MGAEEARAVPVGVIVGCAVGVDVACGGAVPLDVGCGVTVPVAVGSAVADGAIVGVAVTVGFDGGFMKSSRSEFSFGGFIGAPGAASGVVELPHAAATRPTTRATTPETRPWRNEDEARDMRRTLQPRAGIVQTRSTQRAR